MTCEVYTVKVFDDRTEWHQNGKLHRLDGPAIECADGDKEWWVDDKWHRLDVIGRKLRSKRHANERRLDEASAFWAGAFHFASRQSQIMRPRMRTTVDRSSRVSTMMGS